MLRPTPILFQSGFPHSHIPPPPIIKFRPSPPSPLPLLLHINHYPRSLSIFTAFKTTFFSLSTLCSDLEVCFTSNSHSFIYILTGSRKSLAPCHLVETRQPTRSFSSERAYQQLSRSLYKVTSLQPQLSISVCRTISIFGCFLMFASRSRSHVRCLPVIFPLAGI